MSGLTKGGKLVWDTVKSLSVSQGLYSRVRQAIEDLPLVEARRALNTLGRDCFNPVDVVLAIEG